MPRTVTVIAIFSLMLAGCIYLPRTTSHYNEDCEIEEHHMVLEEHQVMSLWGCSNDGCAVLLAAIGVVSAASAVVSGSVVVTGNVVYWLEEKGRCLGRNKGE